MAESSRTTQAEARRPRVVVIGGGFGGMAAVRELSVADVDVLLLDRRPYNTFQPLLYQVATGGLNPGDVTYSLRAFTARFRNASFRRALVTGVDTDAQQVQLKDRDPVEYDYLVIATGVKANYFGVPGAEEHSMTMYSRTGAIAVRDHIFASIEAAAQQLEGATEPVVVVVGGGATGVEMAGALAELRNVAVPAAFPELPVERVRVVLVEMTDTVLGPFDRRLRDYAIKELRERGVELRLSTSVAQVREKCVVLGDGEEIPSAATIWATGVTAEPVVGGWGFPTGRAGRIEVGEDLRVAGYDNVFAVGDVALEQPTPLPQVAQPAIQGGRHVAVQIRRMLAGSEPEPFHYKDKGNMATIGRSDAIVELPHGIRMKGLVAWLVWVALHLAVLMSNRNRLAAMTNLAVRYTSWPGNLNVITGDPPD